MGLALCAAASALFEMRARLKCSASDAGAIYRRMLHRVLPSSQPRYFTAWINESARSSKFSFQRYDYAWCLHALLPSGFDP
jgi:hypothetical protein